LEASHAKPRTEERMDRPLPQLSLKERREHTIQALCAHFAADRLELAEFEGRLDEAHQARTAEALDMLLHDLPALQPEAPLSAAASAGGLLNRGGRAIGDAVRNSRTLVAFMSGVERRGHWTPARRNTVIAIMGGAELDFRDVDLPPGETELFVFCLMGGAEVIVPPGLAVESSGLAIMGGFAHGSPPERPSPGTPVLRLTGVCLMGGVDISVREPGESAADARRRARARREVQRRRPRP
jgi:hypothetical protein